MRSCWAASSTLASASSRSCCRAACPASPVIRAVSSTNSTTVPAALTPTSIGWSLTVWMTSMAGAMRVAAVSRMRRCQVSRGVGGGACSDSDRIDGCSAAAPSADEEDDPAEVEGASGYPVDGELAQPVHGIPDQQGQQT